MNGGVCRALISAFVLSAYAVTYLAAYPVLGTASGILGCVPTIAAAWVWGARAGFVIGLTVGWVNALHSLLMTGHDELSLAVRAIAALTLGLVGWAVGRLHDVRMELERQVREKQSIAKELVNARAELERRVEERTVELAEAIDALRDEVKDRREAQEAQARLIEERIALEQQLHKAQKMEAIGRLAGGVAHDFNNLLTAIIGFSELAAVQTGEPQKQAVAQIRKAADRASELTRALLAFARQEPVRASVLDVNEIVSGAKELLERLIGEDITLSIALCDETWPVKIPAVQLEQVIVNLAVNARDAMPSGGTLSVSTENVEHELGQFVRIRVRDTGTGMDVDTAARLFEPFFTTKPAGMGTGLGLATSYGIVTQAGGRIHVHSQLGVGTTFEIDLPRAAELRERFPVHGPASGSIARGRETVLVVEDEPLVRSIIELTLLEYGYRVLTADSPARALELVRGHRDIELVLTDVVLPGRTGSELVRSIRRSVPDVAALFVSGYSLETIRQRGKLTEPSAFLAKPFTPEALAEKVREVLDAQRSDSIVVPAKPARGAKPYLVRVRDVAQ